MVTFILIVMMHPMLADAASESADRSSCANFSIEWPSSAWQQDGHSILPLQV